VLEKAGLISRGREAQWRPCKIDPTGIERIGKWVDQYRGLWDERFGRMDSYLAALTKGKPNAPRQ
jgi:hypothetical protein